MLFYWSDTRVAQMLKRSIGTRCIPPPYVFVPQELLTEAYRSLGQIENDSCFLIPAAFQNSCQPRREAAYPPLIAEKLKKCCL